MRHTAARCMIRNGIIVPGTLGSRYALVSNLRSIATSSGKITIRTPATTANMGPGYDSFGMAVDLYNELTVEQGPFQMSIEGEGSDTIERTKDNMIVKAAETAFASKGKSMPELSFHCNNQIPPARGLGSSSSALVGGLAAGLHFAGADLSSAETKRLLLQLAADAEGHPDNVAPAIFGGFQISFRANETWITQRVRVPSNIQTVLFVPDFEMKTKEARNLVSSTVDIKDAVFNIGRSSLLVNCFQTGDMESLKYAVQDRLHQPARNQVFPLEKIIGAAMDAGAHGAWLSGAGPTIMAICDIFEEGLNETNPVAAKISNAMVEEALSVGIKGKVHVVRPNEQGFHFEF